LDIPFKAKRPRSPLRQIIGKMQVHEQLSAAFIQPHFLFSLPIISSAGAAMRG
jgi:hypothetical protein